MRAFVKQLVPEHVRLLRYRWLEKLRYYPELVFHIGSRLECPFCHWHFRRFLGAGFDYPVLREKQVVGAGYQLDNVCPRCISSARERLVYLYLKLSTSIFIDPLTVLHVAPEPNISRILRTQPNLKYVTADLFEPNVMVGFDVMNLPFADNTFDVVICNHVLEHVANDRAAMAELHRVLKPEGWALLQVPIALAIERTIEDPSAKTEADRIRVFGQNDHVRLYAAADYIDRLQETGFGVTVTDYPAELGTETVAKHALIPEEQIFVCTKSGANS